MKLNVPNPTEAMLGDAFGIPIERQNKIADELDAMVKRLYNPTGGMVMIHNVFSEIAEISNTPEELLYATMNHLQWMARKGFRML